MIDTQKRATKIKEIRRFINITTLCIYLLVTAFQKYMAAQCTHSKAKLIIIIYFLSKLNAKAKIGAI